MANSNDLVFPTVMSPNEFHILLKAGILRTLSFNQVQVGSTLKPKDIYVQSIDERWFLLRLSTPRSTSDSFSIRLDLVTPDGQTNTVSPGQ